VLAAFPNCFGESVLEVGFGHGGFFEHLPPVKRHIGVDLDRDLVAVARARYPGGEFLQADIANPDFRTLLGVTRVDTVFCANVLEHVADDSLAVRNLLSVLCTGGRLLLFVPAFQWLYNDLDRLAGHFRRYSKREVRALVPPGEGEIERLDYFNPIGGIGWWLNGLFPHRSLEGTEVAGQVRLFDSYLLPLSRALDPLTRRAFGQSIVCVVRKR
jgi:SAM-dependent methyltransferase